MTAPEPITLPPLPLPFNVGSTIKCTACGAPYSPPMTLAGGAAQWPGGLLPPHACRCGNTQFGGTVSSESLSPAQFTADHMNAHYLAGYEAGRSRALAAPDGFWIAPDDLDQSMMVAANRQYRDNMTCSSRDIFQAVREDWLTRNPSVRALAEPDGPPMSITKRGTLSIDENDELIIDSWEFDVHGVAYPRTEDGSFDRDSLLVKSAVLEAIVRDFMAREAQALADASQASEVADDRMPQLLRLALRLCDTLIHAPRTQAAQIDDLAGRLRPLVEQAILGIDQPRAWEWRSRMELFGVVGAWGEWFLASTDRVSEWRAKASVTPNLVEVRPLFFIATPAPTVVPEGEKTLASAEHWMHKAHEFQAECDELRVRLSKFSPTVVPDASQASEDREDFLADIYEQCCRAIEPAVDRGLLPGSVVESLQMLVAEMLATPAPTVVPDASKDSARFDWIESHVCDVSRLGDTARTVRISWNNGADYAFVGPRYNATWREAIDAARAFSPTPAPSAAPQGADALREASDLARWRQWLLGYDWKPGWSKTAMCLAIADEIAALPTTLKADAAKGEKS